MYRQLLGVALAASFLLSFGASAQPAAPPPPSQSQPAADGGGGGKLVAIGVGVIAGVAVAEAVGVVDTASLLGGVVGGYLAAWWYDSLSDAARMRSNMRQPTAASAAWRPEQLALAH